MRIKIYVTSVICNLIHTLREMNVKEILNVYNVIVHTHIHIYII